MLSRKTWYAMAAPENLAREYGKGPVLASELARRERIPVTLSSMITDKVSGN